MYIYHTLINALSTHMIHINLNMIFYTHVEHSPTKTIYVKYYTKQKTKSQMNINKQFNCLMYNIVLLHYLLCQMCWSSKLYIGKTRGTLNTGLKKHLADIKHCRDKPAANHFNQADHTIHNIPIKGLWFLFTQKRHESTSDWQTW